MVLCQLGSNSYSDKGVRKRPKLSVSTCHHKRKTITVGLLLVSRRQGHLKSGLQCGCEWYCDLFLSLFSGGLILGSLANPLQSHTNSYCLDLWDSPWICAWVSPFFLSPNVVRCPRVNVCCQVYNGGAQVPSICHCWLGISS